MAMLWFLSCLALLSEVYGQSYLDTYLDVIPQRTVLPPYVVKLWPGNRQHSCGGSILNEGWSSMDPDKVFSILGKNKYTINASNFRWRRSTTSPQEESPVSLASSSDVFNNGDTCVTTNVTYTCDSSTSANNQQGGDQKSTEDTSGNSQRVIVPILTDDECQKHWGTKSQKNEICTGLSSCMVDSGAGLLCKRNETWIMAGIASSSCSKSKPAMFTHMSTFEG